MDIDIEMAKNHCILTTVFVDWQVLNYMHKITTTISYFISLSPMHKTAVCVRVSPPLGPRRVEQP